MRPPRPACGTRRRWRRAKPSGPVPGQLYLLTSDRANTLKSFERALELRPTDVPTIVRLGEAYLDQGRTEDAERLFLRAREIDPRSGAAFEGLGRVAQTRGDQARAVEYLEQTLTLDPQATRVHYPLAQSYGSLGQQDKAEAHLQQRGDGRPGVYDPLMQAYCSARRQRRSALPARCARDASGQVGRGGGSVP